MQTPTAHPLSQRRSPLQMAVLKQGLALPLQPSQSLQWVPSLAFHSLHLFQVKKMSSSFGSSLPLLALPQPLVVVSLLQEADIYIASKGGDDSS